MDAEEIVVKVEPCEILNEDLLDGVSQVEKETEAGHTPLASAGQPGANLTDHAAGGSGMCKPPRKVRCVDTGTSAAMPQAQPVAPSEYMTSFLREYLLKFHKTSLELTTKKCTQSEVESQSLTDNNLMCESCKISCCCFERKGGSVTSMFVIPCSVCQHKCSREPNSKEEKKIRTKKKNEGLESESSSMNDESSPTKTKRRRRWKTYACSLCQFRSDRKKHLTEHKKVHPDGNLHECSVCHAKFNKKFNYNTHMKTHEEDKPFQCSVCKYQCVYKSSLIKHMRTHTGEKPYACALCDYKSSTSSRLITHVRTHTGEKPYECSLCRYRCIYKSSLQKHMRIHTGEKPYECSVCYSKFRRKQHLAIHLKTHSGEKSYSCSFCQFRCNRKTHMAAHLSNHTEENTETSLQTNIVGQ